MAAEAVLFHDITSSANSCGLPENVLGKTSFLRQLLILCDELAMWSRPKLRGERTITPLSDNEVLLKFDLEGAIKDLTISTTKSRIDISFSPIEK